MQENLFGGIGVLAGDIKFTAVTLSADPPELDESCRAPQGAQARHEDDWRQIELVSAQNVDYLNRVFEEQYHFRNRHSLEFGFTGLYLRKEYPIPLKALNIPTSELFALGGGAAATALYMGPTSGAFRVKNGYAVEVPNIGSLYFSAADSLVRHAGIARGDFSIGLSNETLAAVHAFASRHALLLVDWYQLNGFYLNDIDSFIQWLGWEAPPRAES